MKIYLTGSKYERFKENPTEFTPGDLVFHLFKVCPAYRSKMIEKEYEKEMSNKEFTMHYRLCTRCAVLDAISDYK